ncbi:FK506-binding protein 15 [Hoplias malabaricus]|uniref:FK506-binding protein 15 n=1 Tax=Hoplias malabaricus TaxID=27720 RepID=UPI003461F5F2
MKEVEDFFPDYYDEEFLAPKSGAKLASLFDLDQAESQGNESFQFTAPKQPKRNSTTTGPRPQKAVLHSTPPAILLATGVYAFHFMNGQYIKQGKLGAAILGNHETKEYTVLLYGSQQNHITTARIYPGFVLTVQAGNYASFYDNHHQNWSIKFDSDKAGLDFCKEVCLARWNSQLCMDTLIVQDLLKGEGEPVNVGDIVEVVFTGWLLQNHTTGQMYDTNIGQNKVQQVRLGSDEALKGWEEGMVGMQKGGRRLLIVPPSMGYNSSSIPNHVPSSTPLVFDVEIRQVTYSKDADCLSEGSTDSNYASSASAPESLSTDQSTTCSFSDQGDTAPGVKSELLTNLPKYSDPAKAKLISRIAKMGQPTLPFLKGANSAQTNPTDSKTEHYAISQLHPFASVISAQNMPYQTADISSFLMTEIQQHNTEIQLAVGRLVDSVAHLVSKVDKLQKQGFSTFDLPTVSLETATILQNTKRIIQENASLKNEALEKGSKVEEQKRKRGDLIEQGHRYMEQSSLPMEQRTDAILNNRQQNNAKLPQAAQEQLRDKELHHQQRATKMEAKLKTDLEESHYTLVSSLQAEVEELKKEAEWSHQQWRTEKQKCRKMELTVKIMEEEIDDLKAEKETLNQMLLEQKRKWQLEREHLLIEQEEQDRISDEENKQLREQLRKARIYTESDAKRQLQNHCNASWTCNREIRVSVVATLGSAMQKLHCVTLGRGLSIKVKMPHSTALSMKHNVLYFFLSLTPILYGLGLTVIPYKGVKSGSPASSVKSSRNSDANPPTRVYGMFTLSSKDTIVNVELKKVPEYWHRPGSRRKVLGSLMKGKRRQMKLQIRTKKPSIVFCVVKQVMNELFYLLNTQFDLLESYTGHTVLKILLKTIKHVTIPLQDQESKADDEGEVYLSTEEMVKGQMEESRARHESLDQTYMTAEAMTYLELTSDSSASILKGLPMDQKDWH